jgi:nifR3 family TIM-barrel protein
MFKIGDVVIKNNVVLAPMAGYTSFAYRKFMNKFGVGLSYTEMISDAGLLYENKETTTYLPKDDDVSPIVLQIFGGNKETLIAAVKKLEASNVKYDILDINLGCPMPKVTGNNGGSAWLKDEDKLIDMLTDLVKVSKHPVSVKMRLGWDDNHINYLSLIPKIEATGVKAIALHLRTTKQLYSGKVNYELARDLQDKMSIPLIISGDIFTLDDAINALNITKAKGVMVARGGIGNPNLIKQISTYYETGKKLLDPTLNDQINYLVEFMDLLIEEKGEFLGIKILRGIAPHFFKGFHGIKKYRLKLSQDINSRNDVMNIISELRAYSETL